MVNIAALFVYPIKSCRGIALEQAALGRRGIEHDREFLVVDQDSSFLTQRNAPELARVEIGLEENGLSLQAEGVDGVRLAFSEIDERSRSEAPRQVTIFRDQLLADDVGERAAEWFSAVLQRPCRLVRIGPASVRTIPQEDLTSAESLAAAPEIAFPDAFPILMVSEASLADLNNRLPEPIPMNRFRPNIVVRGCEPYDENRWETVRVGEVVFGCATTCLRCVMTSIDQATGIRQGVEPLRTLATYRRSPDGKGVIFGQYMAYTGQGMLRVGDSLTVEP